MHDLECCTLFARDNAVLVATLLALAEPRFNDLIVVIKLVRAECCTLY